MTNNRRLRRLPRKVPAIGTGRACIFQPLETRRSRAATLLCATALLLCSAPAGLAAVVQNADGHATITASNAAPARPGPEALAPTNATAPLKLRPGNPEDALKMARHLEFHPADADAWRLLGEYHFRRAEYALAATNFSRGLQQSPDDLLCANNLAAALVVLGRLDEARKMLEARVSLHPKNYSMRFNLACIAARQGRKADALDRLIELEQIRWPALSIHLADPDLDPLRGDPPFIAIQKRVQSRPVVFTFPEPERVDGPAVP